MFKFFKLNRYFFFIKNGVFCVEFIIVNWVGGMRFVTREFLELVQFTFRPHIINSKDCLLYKNNDRKTSGINRYFLWRNFYMIWCKISLLSIILFNRKMFALAWRGLDSEWRRKRSRRSESKHSLSWTTPASRWILRFKPPVSLRLFWKMIDERGGSKHLTKYRKQSVSNTNYLKMSYFVPANGFLSNILALWKRWFVWLL